MPPPTVNGIASRSATRRTRPTSVSRPSIVAATSRKTSSSAPASEYASPSSTGSPTSRRPWKRTPLTTRPPATSRHGIRRGRGIARGSALLRGRSSPGGTGRRRSCRTRPRPRSPPTTPSPPASPPRTSARSRTPRRPGRRAPSRCGERALREPHGASWQEGKSTDATVLVRRLERQLEAQADPERRLSHGDPLSESVVERAGGETLHGGARRAHAGENGEIGARHHLRVARRVRVGAEALEGQDDRAHVAGAVLADGDPHRSPFVDGTPGALGPHRRAERARPP